MNTLLRFLLKYSTLLLFLLLQGISMMLIVRTSNYQQTQAMNVAHAARSRVYDGASGFSTYLSLKSQNEQLHHENTQLRNQLSRYLAADTLTSFQHYDSVQKACFTYLAARVVNSSTNQLRNTLAINVGSNEGVMPDMGVISSSGAVGIVTNVSKNYATVIPIINVESRTSAKLLRSGCIGTVSWKGESYREAMLSDIPQHIDVRVGDTVVTSGHSLIFPQNIMLGIVKSFEVKKGNFYEIAVALSVDFKRLQNVYVLKSDGHIELDSLYSNSKLQ